MSKNIGGKIIDVTGVELTLGNGDMEFECCCDECNYFLLCFPEFDVDIEKEINPLGEDNTAK